LIAGETNDKRVLLFGDSHSIHYFQVMSKVAQANSVSVHYLRGDITSFHAPEKSLDKLTRFKPDLVIISQYNQDIQKARNLRRNLDYLKFNGYKVLYISESPVFQDYLLYEHFINPSLLSGFISNEPEMRVPRSKLNSRTLQVAETFQSVVKSMEIQLIDPFMYLCDSEYCNRKVDEQYLYFDDNHLSVFGASLLEKPINHSVSRLLNLPSKS
jgi:hypothetical protein